MLVAQADTGRTIDERLDDPADRWFTVPNGLSVLRLAGIPVFLWLILGRHADVMALVVLAASGLTDWLDGKLARWLGQTTRLGALLDPAADRLYIVATLVAFAIRDIVPWWLVALLVGKDVVVGLCLPVLRRYGYDPPEVHYIGKAATFALLYAFPLLLLAHATAVASAAPVVTPLSFALTAWGTGLYVWSGVLYVLQVVIAVRTIRRVR